ncbi:MAG: hypothetical protein ABIA75_11015 [Candidatus Neomarinimicrobiota bacterium]
MNFTLILMVMSCCLTGQDVRVTLNPPDDSGFIEYVTYYISGFDIQAGASNFQFFQYTLQSNIYPADAKIEFTMAVRSPALGLNSAEELMRLESNRFRMPSHPIRLDNRDLSANTSFLYDQASPPNAIPIQVTTTLDATKFDALISSVLTSGKIVDGEYRFNIKIRSGNPGGSLSSIYEISKSITVRTPTSIQLQSPGGALADTAQNLVYTTYPLFMWNSGICSGCEFFIRIAEFNPEIHSSPNEAIEDETMVPLSQSQPWAAIGAGTSYQYPPTGARPLQPDRIYVWQVRKTFQTTSGTNEILSSIYCFKIGDAGAPAEISNLPDPIVQALMNSLGTAQYEALFGDNGVLKDYRLRGNFSLNGTNINASTVAYILSQIVNQNVTVTGVRVE